jgi:hypothetical protein
MAIPEYGTRYWLMLGEHSLEFLLFCGVPRTDLGPKDMRQVLKMERDSMLRILPDAQVVRDEPITFQGFAGQEMEIEGTKGQRSLVRVFLAGKGRTKRLYELKVGGFDVQPRTGHAALFFDSFRLDSITSPAPTKGAKNTKIGPP